MGYQMLSGFEHSEKRKAIAAIATAPATPPFDACRYRIGFQGKPHADELGSDGQALNNATLWW